MMKFHATIATCLATYFVSGMGQDSEALLALNKQLEATDHSLQVMNQLKQREGTDPDSVTALLLTATEPAAQGQSELDRRLEELRQELSVLSMETEIVLGTGGAPQHHADDGGMHPAGSELTGSAMQPMTKAERMQTPSTRRSRGPAPRLVSGLSPRVLAILGNTQSFTRTTESKSEKGKEMLDSMPDMELGPNGKPKLKSIRLNGYSANPMLQAKASYRAGLYEDCLVILKDQKSPAADHLRARCLNRLDRFDEAVTNLTRIIALDPESSLAKRAAKDKEFALWMMSTSKQLMQDGKMKGGN